MYKGILRFHWTYFSERTEDQSHREETTELKMELPDQQKPHGPSAHRTLSQEAAIQSLMLYSAYQPLKEIKGSLVVKLMQTKLFLFR